MGSLKAACAPLADSPDRAALAAALAGRDVWLAGPTHPEDEAVALDAHLRRLRDIPHSLLILAPRLPDRRAEVIAACAAKGLAADAAQRRRVAGADTQVWIADTFGEMGLWYRLSRAALIGGSFGPVAGAQPLGSRAPWRARPARSEHRQLRRRITPRWPQRGGACLSGRQTRWRRRWRAPILPTLARNASDVQHRAEAGLDAIRDRLLALLP